MTECEHKKLVIIGAVGRPPDSQGFAAVKAMNADVSFQLVISIVMCVSML